MEPQRGDIWSYNLSGVKLYYLIVEIEPDLDHDGWDTVILALNKEGLGDNREKTLGYFWYRSNGFWTKEA